MSMEWHRGVIATHEEPQITSLGPWPGDDFLGVALPSVKSLRKKVLVAYQGLECIAEVYDVGPWCHDDDDYVFGPFRPRAEIFKGRVCPVKIGSNIKPSIPDGNGGFREVGKSNGAGIDLFPATAKALGIPLNLNVLVDWQFIDTTGVKVV